MTATLDLWPIGNCQVSALVDRAGRFVWGCVPRVDGDPMFSSLLDPAPRAAPGARGFWEIDLEDCVETTQFYLRNTPVLVTRHADAAGNAIEVTDFCPRYFRSGRMYRPVAYARIVRPVSGSPRIRIRLRPSRRWGSADPTRTRGSNHIRFLLDAMAMRLTTNAPVGWIEDERMFRVERPLHFHLGPDESFNEDLVAAMESMLDRTIAEWRGWVRGLAVPAEWQEAVIRSAIALKLCQHEETGAIVAALTTSIPEHAGSGRNWDYRFCWLRDAYYTVQALNRLGALDVLESYLEFLRNIVDNARDGQIQPLYGVGGEANLTESEAEGLGGYRGMGPVRIGNDAYRQNQHDAFGQIVLSSAQAFYDHRLFRTGGIEDFRQLEPVGDRAWDAYDQPDAGLWELRNSSHVHTYSAAMCWAACDRLAKIAANLGLEARREHWRSRADAIRAHTIERAWRPEANHFSASFQSDYLDASLLLLADIGFLAADDPRYVATVEAIGRDLRRGDALFRYIAPDDFGEPETSFTICTFWYIDALAAIGRTDEARAMFERVLERRNHLGLLSEDTAFEDGEAWGNFPQTYSHVGLIIAAMRLSRSWQEAS
jgi:GH15 family glucan-1,4-alpha-glucosidase